MIQENIVNTDFYVLKWTKLVALIRFIDEYRIDYLAETDEMIFLFSSQLHEGHQYALGKCLFMEDYNFLSDLLDTFQSSSDLVKIVCLLIPPGFVLAIIALLLHHHTVVKQGPHRTSGHYPAYDDYNDNIKSLIGAKTPTVIPFNKDTVDDVNPRR